MPQPRKPARLYLRRARKDPSGRGREAVYLIRERGRPDKSTGCGPDDIEGAQRELAKHLALQYAAKPLPKGQQAAALAAADVIRRYAERRAGTVARPGELMARLERLLDFWGDMSLDDVDEENCNRYAAWRKSDPAARRELEDLRAAIRMAQKAGICRDQVFVTLPRKSASRVEWFERDEAALLIRSVYRHREVQRGERTARYTRRHLVPFILTAIYTTGRSSRIYKASYIRSEGSPWVDLDAGIFYRKAPSDVEYANKRSPSIGIPQRLLTHMRRWHAAGAKYVVEMNGRPVDPKKAYARAVADCGFVVGKRPRHILRHTGITWLARDGTDVNEICSYAGITAKVFHDVYAHHHPSFHAAVGESFTRGTAGRVKRAKRK